MFNTTNSMTPADIAAITGNNNNDGWGANSGWFWIIILIVLFGGWGYGNGGFGNGNGGVTDGYVLASDFSNLSRQLDNGIDSLRQQGVALSNGICSLGYDQLSQFNAINSNINTASQNIIGQMNNNAVNSMQDTFALQTAINGVNVNNNNNTNLIGSQLTNLSTQLASCCCDNKNLLNTSFGNLKYDMAAQDCQIRQTVNDVGRNLADVQNANTRAILDAIHKMGEDAKDEKIATLQAQVTQMKAVADNANQTGLITNAINAAVAELRVPTPIPAFQVNPPFAYSGCNCNTGCGC